MDAAAVPGPSAPPKRMKRKRTVSSNGVAEELVYPWSDKLANRQFSSLNQQLHYDILAYVDYVQSTKQEEIARSHVFSAVEDVAKGRFPRCSVHFFGSSATGLTIPVGDLDIVVATTKVASGEDMKPFLFQLSSRLRNAGLTDKVQVNFRARVPILTFTTRPEYGSLSVDVGINNTDGLEGASLVKDYLSKMPALRPLILVIKAFLKQRGLGSAATSGLGSYAVICMCISFLQLNPLSRPPEFIEKPMENESLGSLLTDFLEYYGTMFPYRTSYISVKEGKLLPKESASWIETKFPDRLAVQCLLRPENDIARAAQRIEVIKAAFKESLAQLHQASDSEYRLSVLVGMKQTAVDQRAQIRQLVDSGSLNSHGSNPRWSVNHYGRQNGYYSNGRSGSYNKDRRTPGKGYQRNRDDRGGYNDASAQERNEEQYRQREGNNRGSRRR